MKNREKYKNELMDVINKEGNICEFMIKHGVSKMFGKDMESFCRETECTSCTTALQIWLDEEYIEPPKPEVDWSNVPVDTLVRVRDYEDDEWLPRYFKGFNSAGHPQNTDPDVTTRCYEVWALGATSVTAEWDTESWKYCELVKDEDNGKKTFDFDK